MTTPEDNASAFDEVVNRLHTESLKWRRYGEAVLPLWVADMDFRAPEPVREKLRAAIEHGVFGYELPSHSLAESVAARMHRLYGWEVSPESVVATPGIVAGFMAATRAVCNPGEGVIVQPPVYHPFLEVPAHSETVVQTAPLRAVHNRHILRYEIDWGAFEAAIDSNGAHTAMFLLCHPHNPTGQIYSRGDLEKMAAICERHNIVICSDEIHSELLLGGARHAPLATLHPEVASRTITLVSPSKTFNLVGLFCGFAVIPNARLRGRYRRVLHHLALHVNSLGLIAAKAAFSGACETWLRDLRQYLTDNRDLVVRLLSDNFPGVRVTLPDATYLIWIEFGELVKEGKIQPGPHRFFLEQANVALSPGNEFGNGGETCARLNFGCPRSTLMNAMQRMKDAVMRA